MNPALVALAAARLTDLIVEDEITRPAREAIFRWGKGADLYSLRERLTTLSQCRKCTGIWSAAAILLAARTPAGRPLVAVLAAAEAALLAAATLERLDR